MSKNGCSYSIGGESKNMLDYLRGKKSYIMSALLVIYAISGVTLGKIDVFEAVGLIFGSGVVASLRAALGKING